MAFATAVGAATTATVASTGATVAQTTATGGATLAQRALNLALTLNPIGLAVVAVGALVGAYYAWRGASDTTQKKVRDITETVLRFGTPIGLLITGFQKLSEKSETVRRVLGTLGTAFDFVAGKVATAGREAGEAVGLFDTAAAKAAKASAAAVENSEKEILSYQLRARELEKTGAAIEQYRNTEREGFAKHLQDLEVDNVRQNAQHVAELARIDAKKAAGATLSKAEQKAYDERREREQKLGEARLALAEFDQTTQDQLVARAKAEADARKKAFDAAKADSEKAKKLAEQNLKDEYASRAKLLENRQQQIARALKLTRQGSEEGLQLLREQARNATAIQLAGNSGAQVGAAKKEAAALVATRKEIVANGQAEELKRVQAFAQQRAVAAFQASLDNLSTELAGQQEGTDAQVRIQQDLIRQQLALDLASIDKRQDLAARQAQENRLRAEAGQRITELEYQQSLRNLEAFFADQEQAIERDHASGLLAEKTYQQALLASQQARVEAGKVLNRDYHRDTTDLNRRGAELDADATARYRDEIQERIKLGQEFGQQAGQLFAELLTEQGNSLESFTTGVLLLLLDVLEKQMLATVGATVFASTAGSIATPQSVLTGGAAGFAQAALLSAAITAAFEVGRAVIKSSITKPANTKFAQGGLAHVNGGLIAQGPAHQHGGIPLYRNGLPTGIEIEGNEPVLTAAVSLPANRHLLAAASAINVAAGGRPLIPGSTYAHLALGGLATPLILERAGSAGAPIDYARLGASVAEALRKQPPTMHWSDFKAAEKRAKYTDSLSSF